VEPVTQVQVAVNDETLAIDLVYVTAVEIAANAIRRLDLGGCDASRSDVLQCAAPIPSTIAAAAIADARRTKGDRIAVLTFTHS
jgi:hypothetical protein